MAQSSNHERYSFNRKLQNTDFLFESRVKKNCPLTAQQYTRIVKNWINSIDLDPTAYSKHDEENQSIVDL
jgi:hypothetical protein